MHLTVSHTSIYTCFLLQCRTDLWTNLTIDNLVISNVIGDQSGVKVEFYVIMNSGGILKRQALIDAIQNAILGGNHNNAGLTGYITILSMASLTEDPTTGNIISTSKDSLDGSTVTVVVVISINGLIIILALILAIVVYIKKK